MTSSPDSVNQAKRYIDSTIEIDRRAGHTTEVPTEVYDRVVKRVALVTKSVRVAAKKAGRASNG